ncbi:MAG TPA: helix-turn-helix domain-containing protein [Reyranella sp.]|jgi:CRP/FNR family nitrogen fixation transcriptional regulator|nr:helix-turn-helix domain-containing protein [Reyranella sp.]
MPAQRAAIEEGLGGTPKRLAKGESLFEEGEEVDSFYKVVSGCLRTARFLADGQRQIDAFHFRGDIVGLEFGRKHRSVAQAVSASSVIAYRRGQLNRSPEIDQAVRDQAINGALRSLERAQNHILLLGRKSIAERIAAFLLEMSERIAGGADEFSLPMERADIADHVGTSTETVSRVLTRFSRLGLMRMRNYYSITLCNRSALVLLIRHPEAKVIARSVRPLTERRAGAGLG